MVDDIEYTLGEGPEITPALLANELDVAKCRKGFLDLVERGATPEWAAKACGIVDWQADPVLAAMAARLEAAAICQVEQHAFALMVGKGAIPTGLQFWLKARAGWNDREDTEGLPQEIKIVRQVVNGEKTEAEERAANG